MPVTLSFETFLLLGKEDEAGQIWVEVGRKSSEVGEGVKRAQKINGKRLQINVKYVHWEALSKPDFLNPLVYPGQKAGSQVQCKSVITHKNA